jgi:RHS repeat-associated protein
MSETTESGSQEFVYDQESDPSLPRVIMDGTNAYLYGPEAFGQGTSPLYEIDFDSSDQDVLLLSTPQGVQVEQPTAGDGFLGFYNTYGFQYWADLFCFSGPCPDTDKPPMSDAGGYLDATGLIYDTNRYYDPSTQQFISTDPLVNTTHQPYEYAGDDPVNQDDPSGDSPLSPVLRPTFQSALRVVRGLTCTLAIGLACNVNAPPNSLPSQSKTNVASATSTGLSNSGSTDSTLLPSEEEAEQIGDSVNGQAQNLCEDDLP